MSTTLARIADRVLNRPLMIHADKLALIASLLDGRIGIDATGLTRDFQQSVLMPDASRYVGEFEPVDPNDPRAGRKPYRTTKQGVAVIPVIGSLVNRGSWLDAMSGITSYEKLKYEVSAAMNDSAVKSILLDMDSPGGEAVGAFEAADVVREASKKKQIVAVVNGMACSAAYAIAAASSKVVATPSGLTGSIGVVMLHMDNSVRLHDAGVKPTLIFAGARKVDGNPYQPLTDEVKGELKAEIDSFYDLFVASVASVRPMTEQAVRDTEARVYLGAQAVEIGLADEVGSFETALAELNGGSGRNPNPKGNRMTTSNNNPAATTFTQADVDAAVTKALAAGRDGTLAEGQKAGATAERDRFKAVLGAEAYKGREASAHHLLLTTDMTAEERKSVV